MPYSNKIGLALGSGGFRGPAHIGVLKILVDNNIPIDYISGSSIGALIGAHFALFKDINKLEVDFLKDQKNKRKLFTDLSLRGGLINGRKLEKFLREVFGGAEFKDLKIPMKIIATDLISGETHIFDKGDLALAVRASISLPLAFKPVKFKNKLLVDGGLSLPVPDSVVRNMGADKVISVNLYDKYNYDYPSATMPRIVMRGVELILGNLAKNTMHHSNIIIEPKTSEIYKASRLKKYFDGDLMQIMLRTGETATQEAMLEIKKLLK